MPAELPPLHTIRLGDWYIWGLSLRALCSCGAERVVPNLVTILGPEYRLTEQYFPILSKRLTCLSCGKRGPSLRIERG